MPRIVLFPLENASGRPASTRDLLLAVEVEMRRHFDVVGGDILEEFLARHRLRFTGGVDRRTAAAAREELGADAILITSLVSYRSESPAALGITMRLVSAGDPPIILWMDHASFAGDQAPGFLRLGVVDDPRDVRARVLSRLVGSLRRALAGEDPDGPGCVDLALYDPKVRFRSRLLDDGTPRTIAVVPFLNRSARRNAGDVVSLEFTRQLVVSRQFQVLEPGVVRDFLLRARVIMPGGVSLEATRMLLGAMEADLVLSGVVLDYEDGQGARGPVIRFTATALETRSGDVVWQSRSFSRGNDGVVLFGIGRVATPGELTCRMVEPVVAQLRDRGRRRAEPASGASGMERRDRVAARR